MNLTTTSLSHLGIVAGIFDELETYYWVKAEIAVNQQVITHLASFVPLYDKLHDIRLVAKQTRYRYATTVFRHSPQNGR